MCPKKFDSSNLTDNDKDLLKQFLERRHLFDKFIIDEKLKLFTCPGCGFPTLDERRSFEICTICKWEDDGQDNEHADEIWGGPNGDLSLTENRIIIGRVLQQLASEKGGEINCNPKEVLLILTNHNKRMDKMSKMIPLNKELTRKDFSDWYKAENDLLE